MALNLFEVESGFIVDGSSRIAGTGNPGASGGLPDDVAVGALYLNTTNGEMWTKVTAGTGADKWRRQATEEFVQNFFTGAISWREPVVVHDDVSTTLPTGTPTQTITVDGETISDGDRVLFGNLTGGDGRNVYVYDQTNGVFLEDANNETAGDTVYVTSGTSAGKVYNYNGTDWVLINQSSVDELGFIRSFIGKDGTGSENPSYSSSFQITQNNDLEGAIGELDTAIGADPVPASRIFKPIVGSNAVNLNIDNLDEAIGADSELTPLARTVGAITLNSSVYTKFDQLDTAIGIDVTPVVRTVGPISASNSVNANIDSLDTAIGLDVTPISRTVGSISAANSVNANIDSLDTAIGGDVTPLVRTTGSISAASSTNSNVDALDTAIGSDADLASQVEVSTANSVNANLSALDETLSYAYRVISDKTNVTTDTLLDEVLVDDFCTVTWEVCAEGALAGDAVNKYVAKVHAAHNGHNKGGGVDANEVDKDVHSVLKLGSSLGVSLSVVLSGTGASQTMQLRATASTASDIKIRRTEALPM